MIGSLSSWSIHTSYCTASSATVCILWCAVLVSLMPAGPLQTLGYTAPYFSDLKQGTRFQLYVLSPRSASITLFKFEVYERILIHFFPLFPLSTGFRGQLLPFFNGIRKGLKIEKGKVTIIKNKYTGSNLWVSYSLTMPALPSVTPPKCFLTD